MPRGRVVAGNGGACGQTSLSLSPACDLRRRQTAFVAGPTTSFEPSLLLVCQENTAKPERDEKTGVPDDCTSHHTWKGGVARVPYPPFPLTPLLPIRIT